MNILFSPWEFLSRDVAFLGGPDSPMLSWLGSCGILLLCLWQILKLKKEITVVRQAFGRLRPMLSSLTEARRDMDRTRFTPHPGKGSPRQAHRPPTSHMRIDGDDLQTLDARIQQEPIIQSVWAQYRMTLILEQVPWFIEPRIFSTRRAAEIFTPEALFSNRINLAFYRQFPSLITGFGLLLTFLALFIGLGKLHAEGGEIIGIQGLINGLAGKFLTSIVGLIMANIFTFTEKPLVTRLLSDYQGFLSLIDQLFSRKTMEQMLEQLTNGQAQHQDEQAKASSESRAYHGDWAMNGLAGPTANLTAAIQSLSRLQQDEHAESQRAMTHLSRIIKEELHGPLDNLSDAIHHLTSLLKEPPNVPALMPLSNDDRPLLWKNSTDRRTASPRNVFEKIGFWPKRPGLSRERRTG